MDRLNIIKRDVVEIISEQELNNLLEEKKNPVAYWGTAPTGRVHIGYFIPILKIADFIKAGFTFKVLLADLHAYLDDQKTPWDLLDHRTVYYKEVIVSMLKAVGVDTKKVKFVVGSDFQLGSEYALDVLRMSGLVTLNRAKRAAAEVVRFTEESKVGSFVYPLMQIADIVHLEADVAYSGLDQRHIYALGREILPSLNYNKPICVFTPMLPGLVGEKMSASETKSKIDVLNNEDEVIKKVNSAYCVAGELKNNGVLSFIEHVLFPLNKSFIVKRDKRFGANETYKDYKDLENDFVSKKIHPLDLKRSVADELNDLLKPIRENFKNKQDLIGKAYPQ